MPLFIYSAIAADGMMVNGKEKAGTIGDVHDILAKRGLQPISVALKKGILQLELTKKKVKRKDLMHLSRQLAVFIKAGIPILEAIQILGEESNKLLKTGLLDMARLLESGDTFAQAAGAHPEIFPNYYLEILRSAELTGNLDQVLEQLADYLEREMEAKRKVISAITYPIIVLALSVVTCVILVLFVLPKFVVFFESLDADLPLPTRMLLGFSEFMTRFAPFIGIGLLVMLVTMVIGLRTEKGRNLKDQTILKLPIIGGLIKVSILERFCRILSSMTSSGVSLPEALAVTSAATNNYVFRRGIAAAQESMMRGEGLAAPLAATGLFPAAARQMMRVGEDTGTLDEQLVTAADYFDRELDYKIKQVTNMLEPAVILFTGLVVGFVAVALVSAMYGIFNQVDA
jgi:type IV pilus assembly protein PilC